MNLGRLSFGFTSVLVLGCGGEKSTGVGSGSITLSAAQATALMTKIELIAPLKSDLAWLADSANLVLRSGAVAERIALTTNLSPGGPFYAVGLQRKIQSAANTFSTFDLIAFNDPSNPTEFLIVNGFKSSTTTPPASVSGSFGGATIHGHLFRVVGNSLSALTHWTATLGTASFSTGAVGSACTEFQDDVHVTCSQADLNVSFSIDLAPADLGAPETDDRTAALGATTVPGILLSFHY